MNTFVSCLLDDEVFRKVRQLESKLKMKSARISVNIWSYENFEVAELSGCMRAVQKCTQNNSRAHHVTPQNLHAPHLTKGSGLL